MERAVAGDEDRFAERVIRLAILLGDGSPCFLDQDDACSNIPRADLVGEECIDSAAGEIGQVHGRGTSAAKPLRFVAKLFPCFDDIFLASQECREADSDEGIFERSSGRAANGSTMLAIASLRKKCSLILRSTEEFIAYGIVDHAQLHPFIDDQPDGNGIARKVMNVVGGTIERIDNPEGLFGMQERRPFGSRRFFTQEVMIGTLAEDHFTDGCLGGMVGIGDEIKPAFL